MRCGWRAKRRGLRRALRRDDAFAHPRRRYRGRRRRAASCPRPRTKPLPATASTLLSGRRHTRAFRRRRDRPDGTLREALSETVVRFKRLSERRAEIDAYIAGGEWHGKAGGYAIQGQRRGLFAWLGGSHSGVMGLPLFETRALLRAAGFAIP